jgi:hypothetical protein
VVSTDIIDVTATDSQQTTAITTVDETATSTVYLTSTSIQFVTVATTISTGAVDTRSATSTKINTATYTTTETNQVTIQARQLASATTVITPSNLPTYATPCSGTIEFSSACSCIGIRQRSTILASPSTTVTVPHTVTTATKITTVVVNEQTTSVSTATALTTDSMKTIMTTVTTEAVTVVDGMSFATRTVSTQTASVVHSTQALVSAISTGTSTTTTTTMTVVTTVATVQTTETHATATTTVLQTTLSSCAGAVPTFALRVRNTDYDSRFLGQYKGFNGVTDNYAAIADASLDFATSTHFHLVGTDVYDAAGRIWCGNDNNFPYYMQFVTLADRDRIHDVNYPCSIVGGLLKCTKKLKNSFYICPNVRDFIDFAPPGQLVFSSCILTAVDFVVVPACLF